MHRLTLHIPDSEFTLFMEEISRFKNIRIENNIENSINYEIKEGLKQAVNEVNLIKEGKMSSRSARDFLNEI